MTLIDPRPLSQERYRAKELTVQYRARNLSYRQKAQNGLDPLTTMADMTDTDQIEWLSHLRYVQRRTKM